MVNYTLRAGCVGAMLAAGILPSTMAQAVEGATPILPAVTAGIPLGATPPDGIYYANTSLFWTSRITNGSGNGIPVSVKFYENINTFLVVPGVDLLGGKYSFFFAQGLKQQTNNVFGNKDDGTGIFNTFFTPLNLSWALTNNLFVSTALSVYFPDGTYRRSGVSNGNAYSTFQPSVAVSYLNDGWNLTANLMLNVNAQNNINQYQSGNLYGVDFTATKSFDKLTVGLQGFYLKQYESDKIGGTVVAATAYNSRGNKALQSGIGPYISYDFGDFTVSAWYDHNIYTENTTAANFAWLKIAVPLGNPFGRTSPVTPSALPDRKIP